MKFAIYVREAGTTHEPWKETYQRADITTDAEAVAFGKALIEQFKCHGEKPREFVTAMVLGKSAGHDWRKTNLARMFEGDSKPHDTYKCRACGVTGKLFNGKASRAQTSGVIRDSAFKAKKFSRCKPQGRMNPPDN